jgi:hypothetical protein
LEDEKIGQKFHPQEEDKKLKNKYLISIPELKDPTVKLMVYPVRILNNCWVCA